MDDIPYEAYQASSSVFVGCIENSLERWIVVSVDTGAEALWGSDERESLREEWSIQKCCFGCQPE